MTNLCGITTSTANRTDRPEHNSAYCTEWQICVALPQAQQTELTVQSRAVLIAGNDTFGFDTLHNGSKFGFGTLHNGSKFGFGTLHNGSKFGFGALHNGSKFGFGTLHNGSKFTFMLRQLTNTNNSLLLLLVFVFVCIIRYKIMEVLLLTN